MTRPTQNGFFPRLMRTHLLSHFMLLACALICAGKANAQLTPVDIAEFYHGSNYMGMYGDTLKFQFTLGLEDDSAKNVAGFDVVFAFPKLNATPTETRVNVAGTWLTVDLQDTEPNVGYDAGNKLLQVSFIRPDETGQVGFGSILEIALLRQGGFTKNEAAMFLDDGIVMVDNINMRMAQGNVGPVQGINQSAANTMVDVHWEGEQESKMPASLTVSPNPASDYVNVTVADPKGSILRLWSLQPLMLIEQACQKTQRLDLAGFPSGSYLLTVESPTRKLQQLIVKR